MRSGNPSLKEDTFSEYEGLEPDNQMTIKGSVNKTLILLTLLIITSIISWNLFLSNVEVAYVVMITSAIVAFIVGLITIFKPKISPITAPIYALIEGLAIGGISASYEVKFDGIVIQAVLLTFGVLLSLLIAYKSGLIKATENFRLGVVAATGGIALVYLISILGRFVGFEVPFLHEASAVGIGISVFIVIVAALNLVLDFDFIESGADRGVPKYMEWYAAFGLMVTLVWLYLEILRLLSKIARKD